MKLTTKGRYAVMAMADLALYKDNGPTSLTDISLRQNISLPYLEQIFIKLKDNNLVKSTRGAKGGYILEKPANEIKISNKTEILKVKNERTSVAAVPRKVAYQGILTKDNGQPADDRMYSVKFRLYNLLEGGEPFWEESQIIFINDGLLSATVGVYNELNKIPANAFLEAVTV